jgi:hypothetical protein
LQPGSLCALGLKSKQTKHMKKTLLTLLSIAASTALAADVTSTTTTTTTTSSGTISEYAPGKTFILKEESGPMTYRYGRSVTYVTKSGKKLSDDDVKARIKVGRRASVHWDKDGEHRVINRVEIDDD